MIAHDLQQPVNAIMLRVQLLIRRVLEEKGRGYVLQIREATEQLSRLIKDLFVASKVEAKRLQLKRQPIALGTLVNAVIDRIPDVGPRAHRRARGTHVGGEHSRRDYELPLYPACYVRTFLDLSRTPGLSLISMSLSVDSLGRRGAQEYRPFLF